MQQQTEKEWRLDQLKDALAVNPKRKHMTKSQLRTWIYFANDVVLDKIRNDKAELRKAASTLKKLLLEELDSLQKED